MAVQFRSRNVTLLDTQQAKEKRKKQKYDESDAAEPLPRASLFRSSILGTASDVGFVALEVTLDDDR